MTIQTSLVPGTLPNALSQRYLLGLGTEKCTQRFSDVLVIGSGIAGLVAALEASSIRTVSLITKSPLAETNPWYAQGGIAGAVGKADSVALHLSDSLIAGQGLSRRIARALDGDAVLGETYSRVISKESRKSNQSRTPRDRAALEDVMQRSVGMSRSHAGLAKAAKALEELSSAFDASRNQPDLEFANRVTVGALITHAAWLQTESRGSHARTDFPDCDGQKFASSHDLSPRRGRVADDYQGTQLRARRHGSSGANQRPACDHRTGARSIGWGGRDIHLTVSASEA